MDLYKKIIEGETGLRRKTSISLPLYRVSATFAHLSFSFSSARDSRNICGCDWYFDGYEKSVEVDTSNRKVTIVLEETTGLALNVIYPKQPERIVVKRFSNGDFPENAEEKSITKDSKHFSISPGYNICLNCGMTKSTLLMR